MKEFIGVVQKGRQHGHELGFPTINIPLLDAGVSGIYAAHVYTDVHTFSAAAFADPSRGILEAHLLNFSGDLYGAEVRIELLKKLRESASYESDAVLKEAIVADIAQVEDYFKN